LGGLIAPGQHHNQNAPASREIQAVARPEIDSHFGNVSADGLPVTEIPCLGKTYSSRDACLPTPIAKRVKPILELLSLEDSEHLAIVSIRILLVKSVTFRPVRPNVAVQPQEPADEGRW